MKDKSVNITHLEGSTHIVVELVNTLGVVVARYKYHNYIGNGDNLAMTCSEWVNFGMFPPIDLKGLEKI